MDRHVGCQFNSANELTNSQRDPVMWLTANVYNHIKQTACDQLYNTDIAFIHHMMNYLFISCLSPLVLQSTCSCVPTGLLQGIQRRNITMTTSPTWLLGRENTLIPNVHTQWSPAVTSQALCHITTAKRFIRWSGTSGSWQLRVCLSKKKCTHYMQGMT